jgi:GNAT superfamily N-acetyltransferase
MEITLEEDRAPRLDFYYQEQFKIYHEPYLIWDQETWEAVLAACTVYRIEVDGIYAGDAILEDGGKGLKYIVDFGILPEYQGKGIGKAALEKLKKMGTKLTAITRKETLPFFLKSGFLLKKTLRSYYRRGVDGYFIIFGEKT